MARTIHAEDLYQGQGMQLQFGPGSFGNKMTGSAIPIKHKAREVAPARAASPYSAPKCCTSCGTNRTPQWREGPAGPKTLCNACGVKLVRKNRSVAEASKRRAAGAVAAEKAAAFLFDRSSPSPEPWSGMESGADDMPPLMEHLHEPSPLSGGASGSKRPVRRAAAKAASRTAEFASTGDWPQDEGGFLTADGHVVRPAAPISAAATHSDVSIHSDSAEEVAWAPTQPADTQDAAEPSGMPPETSAAVNLLTMSIKDEEASAAQPGVAPQSDALVPRLDPSQARSSGQRLNFLKANSDLSVPEQLLEDWLRANAPARFAQYQALQTQAEASWKQASASDAAVAAVAKFLAQKQAAAIKARNAARTATQELHSFLQATDAELGVSRAWKRQRSH